ncbi:MAG TPA: Asp-tRNA(Asn)/Glu-tRNA(Gln) amidotransferase subunit GatB [Candidatus Portnoybacteria bacterium]|nr:Asp-tRNA(Asn)/Glu-tRNA(Gln) amidotransferase subunit GatB [Candidatus Portnoybacteria bacterium]
MKYEPTIGLEIHAELKTKSKMFCSCSNALGLEKEPNVNICPVCTGQPGTLPVINEEAVHMVLKAGLALGGKIGDDSKFDRKNYFYPDLPKGYQISQYDKPLVEGGYLDSGEGSEKNRVRLTRIHLEEDTGKLVHPKGALYSLVDLNRAGLPLMELVTEPDIKSGAQARKFCQELQLIFRYLKISDADMEKGQMRCEVNISISEPGAKKLGTKVEIKNLNSFKVVEKAIDYEIKRQAEALESGEKIVQETRGWDDASGTTFSQRIKEEAHDYRYFPEPDLPPLQGLVALSEELKKEIPELPAQRRARFIEEYNLSAADAETFAVNFELGNYFEKVVSEIKNWAEDAQPKIDTTKAVKLAGNYLITELQKLMYQSEIELSGIKITPENFAEFIKLAAQGVVSSSGAQAVLAEMFKTGADPSHIVKEKDLGQVSDEEELNAAVREAISANPGPVADYKKGKQNSLMFLVGKIMAATKGKANPQMVISLLKKELEK